MFNYYNSKVTVELGEIVESGVNIWDFDYPVPRPEIQYNGKTCKVDFDKKTFEQKVIDHYRFRQIGQETVGRFLHFFRSKIREIMPYYVQVYEFDAKFRNIEDPLESYNLMETFQQQTSSTGRATGTATSGNTQTTTREVTTSGDTVTDSTDTTTRTGSSERIGSSEKTGTSEKVTLFSDTPQGSIDNIGSYLTTATKENGNVSEGSEDSETVETSENGSVVGNTVTESEQVTNENGTVTDAGTGSSEQETEDSGTTSHTLTRRGNIGVQPLGGEVINIRSAFINIDLQIIDELKDLFLKVY